MKSTPYTLINGYLYKLGPYDVLRRCVLEHERDIIIEEAHVGPIGGHFYVDTTTKKIIQVGLWWPIHRR